MIKIRLAAKEKKEPGHLLELADKLRDEVMPELGIRLEDDGLHLWTAVPAETLKQQIQQKKQQALQLALDKKAKRRVALQNEIRRWEEWSLSPEAIFTTAQAGSYSQFSENGLPTHDAQGTCGVCVCGPHHTRSKLYIYIYISILTVH